MKRAYFIVLPLGLACFLQSCAENKSLEKGLRVGPTVTRHTKKNQSVTVYSAYQIGDDCVMYDAPPSVKVITPPRNGKVTIVSVRDHAAYPATSHLFKCNSKLIPMTAVNYQPNPGFTGTDDLTLQTNFNGVLNPPDKTAVIVEVAP